MSFIYHKGITLIELVVGIGVLSFAVAGPMTLAASSLRATQEARNELIATHLASEGFEVVHSVRDNNSSKDVTSDTEWMNRQVNITGFCVTTECIPDVTLHGGAQVWQATALRNCASTQCSQTEKTVYFNPNTGLYRQSISALSAPFVPTAFTRAVRVVEVNATREVLVTSTVTYLGYGGATRTISVSGVLYNWFPVIKP